MKNLITKYFKVPSLLKNKRGATMVEYALVLALVAAVCVTAVTAVGGGAKNKLTSVGNTLALP